MKDLEAKFAEAEKRIRGIVSENKALKTRIIELEKEIGQTKREAIEHQHFQSKRLHIKEKVERILKSLEAIGSGD